MCGRKPLKNLFQSCVKTFLLALAIKLVGVDTVAGLIGTSTPEKEFNEVEITKDGWFSG